MFLNVTQGEWGHAVKRLSAELGHVGWAAAGLPQCAAPRARVASEGRARKPRCASRRTPAATRPGPARNQGATACHRPHCQGQRSHRSVRHLRARWPVSGATRRATGTTASNCCSGNGHGAFSISACTACTPAGSCASASRLRSIPVTWWPRPARYVAWRPWPQATSSTRACGGSRWTKRCTHSEGVPTWAVAGK